MLGSHSTIEDKNPDIIPQEPTSDDEFLSEDKAFRRGTTENMLYSGVMYTSATRNPPEMFQPGMFSDAVDNNYSAITTKDTVSVER